MESERPVLAGARREHPAPRTSGRRRRAGEPAGCTRRLWRAAAFRTEGLTSHNAGHYATCSLPRLSPRHQRSLCHFSIVALIQPLRRGPLLGRRAGPSMTQGRHATRSRKTRRRKLGARTFASPASRASMWIPAPASLARLLVHRRTLRTAYALFRRHVPANSRTLTAELRATSSHGTSCVATSLGARRSAAVTRT